MATLPETAEWIAAIYQLEEDDLVKGGADGIDNLQAKQLANRTLFLKGLVDALANGKQPLDATLSAISGLVGAADKLAYFNGADSATLTTITAFARSLIAANDAAAARTLLGAVTQAEINNAVAALVNSSPAALDTLNEFATALGNDPNFATTVMNALALKAPLASPAFSGTPTAPTPDLFDTSKKLATMEAVQRALGNASGFEDLSANRIITAADAGKIFMVNTAGVVLTFPDSTTLPAGWQVTVLCSGGTSFTLAGSTFASSSGSVASRVEGFTAQICARKAANQYRVSLSGDGPHSFATNGYQKLPSGLIIQWARNSQVGESISVTLPIAFPVACLFAAVNMQTDNGSAVVSITGTTSLAGSAITAGTNATGSNNYDWFAIGY